MGSWVVARVDVLHAERSDGRYLRDVLTGLCPVKVRYSAGQHDHAARRIGPVSTWDPVRVIQEAYRAGRLHVLGKTIVDGDAAYRAEVLSSHGEAGPIVIVDAHTFMPIEMIYHRPCGGPPTLVTHVRSYRNLPATKANLALVRLVHRAGVHVVNVTRQSAR